MGNLILIPHRPQEVPQCRVYINWHEWESVIRRECFRCYYCSTPITIDKEFGQRQDTGKPGGLATPDHLWPQSEGGCDCAVNVVAACALCNSGKKQRTLMQFLQYRPQLVQTAGEFSTSICYLDWQDFLGGKPYLPLSVVNTNKSFHRLLAILSERMRFDNPSQRPREIIQPDGRIEVVDSEEQKQISQTFYAHRRQILAAQTNVLLHGEFHRRILARQGQLELFRRKPQGSQKIVEIDRKEKNA